MLRHVLIITVFAGAFATSAIAQNTTTPAATPPPVDTMTCAEMQAEMTSAGQQMSGHLDPAFSTDAQASYNEAQQREREAQAQAPANALACMIPFMCAAAQQHQQQQAQGEAAENQARMQTQMNRLNASMAGLDQQRLQAISNRWQTQHCQATDPSAAAH